MSSTLASTPSNQDVVAHLCKILEPKDQVPGFFEFHWIKSLKRFIITTVDQFERFANLFNLPLHYTDIDQINLFRTWYTQKIQNKGQLSNESIIQELTLRALDDFCGGYFIYLQQQSQAAQAPQTLTGGTPALTSETQLLTLLLKISLKDHFITTGKALD